MPSMQSLSPEQFLQYSRENLHQSREASIAFKQVIKEGKFSFFCSICNGLYKAVPSDDWNLRNQVICPNCGHGGRLRHLAEVIEHYFPNPDCDHPKIALFEAVTGFAKLISDRYPATSTSEFVDESKPSGSRISIDHPYKTVVTHQDIQQTSYSQNELDAIVHADVYEHIPSIASALSESTRILKKHGLMIFTMPLYDHRKTTLVRSELTDSGILHNLPNEYHGNPVDSKGALVFSEPASDFFDIARELGFKTSISLGFEPFKGYFPDCHPNDNFHCWNAVFILQNESTTLSQ